MKRRTITEEVKYKGVGIHKGEDIILRLKPAPVNTGIVFKRVDLEEGKNMIYIAMENIFELTRGTNLRNEYGAAIYTIEHFMSALYALGVTDLLVEVDGNEMPIIDGSSRVFIEMIENHIHEYDEEVEEIVITEPIYVAKGDKYVIGLPYEGYKITYTINFNHSFLKSQMLEVEVDLENYKAEIAKARTFGFDHEIAFLKANNLALGATLDNGILVQKDGVLNPGGLRYEDEFVRHKILDLIGDLKVLNRPIRGHILAVKAGHAVHNDFVKEIIKAKGIKKIL